MARLFDGIRGRPSIPPRVPDGHRLYAIGDIHGRVDLLDALHAMIVADATAGAARRGTIVYLGDYIDRGDHSRAVIERLLGPAPGGLSRVFLKGNHEEMMLRFFDDISVGTAWLEYGGAATLLSYGGRLEGSIALESTLIAVQADLARLVPAAHRRFLEGLAIFHRAGDYLFVHAGIRPGVPLDEQSPDDLLWIRGVFLKSRADHGVVVVHGHSIDPEIEMRPNRIGIDTGAYATGVLSCLVLDGAERRLLQTGAR